MCSLRLYADNITPRLDKIIVAQIVQEVLQQFDPRKLEAFSLHTDILGHLQARTDSQYVRHILRNLFTLAFLSNTTSLNTVPYL